MRRFATLGADRRSEEGCKGRSNQHSSNPRGIGSAKSLWHRGTRVRIFEPRDNGEDPRSLTPRGWVHIRLAGQSKTEIPDTMASR
jgi:hypothetical protein